MVLLLIVGLTVSGCRSGNGTTTVFAASSLATVFPQISDAARAPATFSFDGSSGLVDQLAGGAPADVLATADRTTMDRAVKAGLVSTPRQFATNRLAIVVARGNPLSITDLTDLTGRKLVVCAPEVPCGRAAAQIAADRSIPLRPVSQELKVADVVGKVASGEADAGLAYTTDGTDRVSVVPLPGAERHLTTLWIAVVTDSPHPAAADAFISAVVGTTGQTLLRQRGFGAGG
ncbi:molybdate ABC transporter substrate-binding protein [Aestuariimicrobium sp. T2.26MG-19.2B]|uniref:molybdate ABC transporter substrate-binding protein n=1 Tax=Aestuariimicrobium sp. T2.26MG-19.2B TaxID=3040679 RepID=UPI0024779889|nr:molybdate ABC transporter substrate-binding protein [Aestuariimicrobium sp. T2.26MG-19.2B]CAI9402370.1 Molybdate-binding protein ModA [Aestuariimicrobium sp. T2.26MG-19.2B]